MTANPALLYLTPAHVPLTRRLTTSTASAISRKNSDPPYLNMAKCKLVNHLFTWAHNLHYRHTDKDILSISTAQKMIRACNTLSIPVYATTQSASRLGPSQSLPRPFPITTYLPPFPAHKSSPVCSELNDPPLYTIDKTAFSMLVPELRYTLAERAQIPYQVAIVGIETHICVTQTALDLLSDGHRVYVLTDGVSSCNGGERGVALNRLR